MQVLAFGALILTSYVQYRERDGDKIAKLEIRISVLESRTGDLWSDWVKQRGQK